MRINLHIHMIKKLLILVKNALVETTAALIAILARKEKEIVTITIIVWEILCVEMTIVKQVH